MWEARVPYALGIDLGTTFSAAAVSEQGRTEIVALGNRAAAVPTVVLVRADGEVLIGEAAERRAVSEPLRTAREFKRRLGDPTPIMLAGTPYGAEALYARMLRGVVYQVVEERGERPEAIVVAHPATYGPYKLDLLHQAVRMAEIGPVTFITEPVAAALHYAGRERIDPGQVVAVYDFGGGTFDAALLQRTPDGFVPLGEPEGIERLGGIDFDEAIFAHVVNTLRDTFDRLNPHDPATSAAILRIREEARDAKEALSIDTDVTIPVILPGVQTSVRLTRREFEAMIEPRIGETIAALERAVRSTGLSMQDVSKVLLVGGSSRIPIVRQRVREATGVPVVVDAHPKHAISLGAAGVAAKLARLDAPQPVAAAAAQTDPPRSALTSAPAAAAAVATVPPVDGGPPAISRTATGGMSNLPIPLWMIAAILAGAFVFGVLAFMLIDRLGGDDDNEGSLAPLGTSSAAAQNGDGPATATVEGTGPPTAEAASSIATDPAGPSRTPGTLLACESDPRPKAILITDIQLEDEDYAVYFETCGIDIDHPEGVHDPDTSQLARAHAHFYWNTTPPDDAGPPGAGPWLIYGGPSPLSIAEYAAGGPLSIVNQPADATDLCAVLVNADHTVIPDTGNCFALP
jgi:actin-like ATPase involved in cell morphogenesis